VKRIVVIGAGPMGLAAATGARERGFDVTVLEAGEVGAALDRWGPVRCFTPLAMNLPEAMLRAIDVDRNALLTGPEMRRLVLEPLVARLGIDVRTHHRVTAIGRRGLTRGDFAGHPMRAERPFVVQADSPDGERSFEAEIVFDATGGYALPNASGSGGLPAAGERREAERFIRDHATLEARANELRGKRVLLLGHGHSAANALLILRRLGANVIWAVRTANQRPCVAVPNDPLPERNAVVEEANALAAAPPEWLRVERRAMLQSISPDGEAKLSGGRNVVIDCVASFTGFHPDSRHLTEVAVELSPITEGGARLYRAIANVTDCLSVPRVRPSDLASGEPNFFFIGSRAYGRARTFLLQTGLAQLETILDSLPK
jgi:thioredoxin reductase